MKYRVVYSDDPKSEIVANVRTPFEAAQTLTLNHPPKGADKIAVYRKPFFGGTQIHYFAKWEAVAR